MYKPCGFKGSKCVHNIEYGGANSCCNKCTLLTFVGCSAQSLGCKSFLCDMAFYKLPKRARNRWRILNEIKDKHFPYIRNKQTFSEII